MRSHIQIAAWLHIALSGLTLLAGVSIFLLCTVFGLFSLHGLPIIGGFGVLIFFFFALFSLPGLLMGVGLLRYEPWARILGIVLSALGLVFHPAIGVGTVIGIYSLWVLLHPETTALIERRGY